MVTEAFVFGVGHQHVVLGVVEVRPRRSGLLVRAKHRLVVGGLRVHQRRRYAFRIVFFIITTVIQYPMENPEKQRVKHTAISQ